MMVSIDRYPDRPNRESVPDQTISISASWYGLVYEDGGVFVGLVGGLAAALCYGLGSIVQSHAASSQRGEGSEVVLTARLLGQWVYMAGLALDLVGFAAAIVALRTLPLFVVQAAIASSVGVTALAAHWWLDAVLTRYDWVTLAVLMAGLALLGASGRPEHARALHPPGPALVLASAAGVAVVAWAGARSPRWAGAVLAGAAGASFGAVGIASRALEVPDHWWRLLGDPLAYAVLVHGALAVLLFAAALQRAPVTAVAGITFAVETVLPAAIGLMVLGDRARAGFLPVAVVGFVLTLGAAIALSQRGDPAAIPITPTGQ
jgi:drug/metabolite transporter (DMT)-like permease